jgi:hypothetical protein
MDDKTLHENTAEANECIICERSATGCYDTILFNLIYLLICSYLA